jgi:hypothetical protein
METKAFRDVYYYQKLLVRKELKTISKEQQKSVIFHQKKVLVFGHWSGTCRPSTLGGWWGNGNDRVAMIYKKFCLFKCSRYNFP